LQKSALAAFALIVGAIAANTASPALAATAASPLTAGPRITITVSCPGGEHAVDHLGQYDCAADAHARHGSVRERVYQAKNRHRHSRRTRLARHAVPARPAAQAAAESAALAAPRWHNCRFRHHFIWQSPYFHFWNWHHTSHLHWQRA
jgi:hypothetical protein